MRRKNTVIMIASLLVITLFIGAGMPSVIAGSIHHTVDEQEVVIDGCPFCGSDDSPDDPSSESCEDAVDYAVDYMKEHVKENMNGTYFLWTVDVVILVFEGLIKGFKESGFTIEIDEEALKANIEYWVNKTVGPQQFTVTLFLAKLGAIAIGVTGYLISLCDDDAQNSPDTLEHSGMFSWIISRIIGRIRVLSLFGL